jgi:ribosomal protein L7/L12
MPETKLQEERESTSIKIKPSVWRGAKIEAIKEGKTLSDIMEALAEAFVSAPTKTIKEAIEDWTQEQEKKKSKSTKH